MNFGVSLAWRAISEARGLAGFGKRARRASREWVVLCLKFELRLYVDSFDRSSVCLLLFVSSRLGRKGALTRSSQADLKYCWDRLQI